MGSGTELDRFLGVFLPTPGFMYQYVENISWISSKQ